jgi:hypothetical protein
VVRHAVRHDQVEVARRVRQPLGIHAHERDASDEHGAHHVARRDLEHMSCEIDGRHGCMGRARGENDGDQSRARADVENALRCR